ncbi:FGGY family of carbohydrate kinase [Sphaerosporella brunnea]|uniref:FGGY family of carbohydrate kinase n=1 Tax=Sphaerosporella brunnea TaxID=1250544 RepID=A0A5J5ED87_9PEZI|nr:FGGY family of carbohydrate kinase [Sphaerosporella brunnea]
MNYYMGVDVGTGSARVCIIDAAGVILAVESRQIRTWNDRPDFYEQSTEDIWSAICHCSRSVLKTAAIEPELVKGIGFDATCSLAVLDEKTDEPISVAGPDFREKTRNVILWMDHRPKAETMQINATNHNLLKYVGGQMSIEMEVPKVLWLKNNMPSNLFERCKFYDLADALTHIATGKETRSFCSTVCKQGYVPVGVDGSVKGWQEDFLSAIGLQDLVKDNFRKMGGVNGENGLWASAGEVIGDLCEQSARELGLKPGVKIGSGVIDAYAGWIGSVGAKVDLGGQSLDLDCSNNDVEQAFHRLAVVAGTSTCHLVMSKDPVFAKGIWGPYRDVLLQGRWLAEGGQSTTGALLHNVLTTHPSYAAALDQSKTLSTNIFDFLNKHLEDMCAQRGASSIGYLARHIFFYGDKHGNRSPIADPNMRGAIVGLSLDSSVDDLALQYYVAMEFIAQQTRHIIDTLNDAGHKITSIFMSGGQCKNGLLMNLIANATGLPVSIPRYIQDAVVLGAAILGAKAASVDDRGETEGLWTIMDRMSQTGRVVYPTKDENEKKLLRAKFDVFLWMAKAQQDYRRHIDDVLLSAVCR